MAYLIDLVLLRDDIDLRLCVFFKEEDLESEIEVELEVDLDRLLD